MLRHRINCPRHTRTSFVSTLYTCAIESLWLWFKVPIYEEKGGFCFHIWSYFIYSQPSYFLAHPLGKSHLLCREGNKKLTSSFLSGLLQSRPQHHKLQILYYVTSLTVVQVYPKQKGTTPRILQGEFFAFSLITAVPRSWVFSPFSYNWAGYCERKAPHCDDED